MSRVAPDRDADFLRRWIVDAWQRTLMHHGFWFREVENRFDHETACQLEQQVFDRSQPIQRSRYAEVLGLGGDDSHWPPLESMDLETLNALMDASAKNWLVNDGVWFQAMEHHGTIEDAMRCNDGAWSFFAPYEAERVRELIALDPEIPVLEQLKTALDYRLYARINKQEIQDDGDDAFLFRMLECRVQIARQRKGLTDYPCKSAGIIEFTGFAHAIHPEIETSCIACPPDDHPRDWFCGWRFSTQVRPRGTKS